MAAAVLGILAVSFLVAWGRKPIAPTAETDRIVLLVLPFRDLSPQPAEYLSQGLTAELIARLGRVHPERLGVIALTTALRYQNTERRVDEIAHELGVQYLIEGSLSHVDDRVRIHIQVIQAADQTQLLSESYDTDLTNLLEIEHQAAERIVASLSDRSLALDGSTERRTLPHAEAYQAFLQGRFHWNQRTEASLRQAVRDFERAIEIDPEYAPAHAGLADSFALFPSYGIAMPADAMPVARAAALRALELDASLAEAHTALALVRWAFEWNHERARESFETATALNTNYATAHQWFASLLLSVGEFEQARTEMRRAHELDPLSLIISTGIALVEFYARDYERAIEHCHNNLELQPDFLYGQELLALSYAQNGDFERALSWLDKRLEAEVTPAMLATQAYIYALAGDRRQALEILDLLMEHSQAGDYVPPYRVALIHAALGSPDQSFRWLDAAVEGRAFEMALFEVDPRFDPLRGTPRFEHLLAQVRQTPSRQTPSHKTHSRQTRGRATAS